MSTDLNSENFDPLAAANKVLSAARYLIDPFPRLDPNQKLIKSDFQALRNKIRETANLKYDVVSGTNTGASSHYLDNINKLQIHLKAIKEIDRDIRNAASRAKVAARVAKRKAERAQVEAQAKVASDQPEQKRIKAATNKIKADKVIAETAPNSNKLGQESSGFKSLTEATKPRTAIPKPNKVNKPEPVPSEMTANVPGITVTKSPSNKSNIDTLVASTTSSTKNLNKVFSSGSAKGIQKSLENPTLQKEYSINAPKVKSAVKSGAALQDLKNDPFIQNSLKKFGLNNEEITEVNKEIDEAIAVVAAQEQKLLAVKPQKDFSVKQFRALGNPIGAPGTIAPPAVNIPDPISSLSLPVTKNPLKGITEGIGNVIGSAVDLIANGANTVAPGNPFGSLGMEFGNIMASVVGNSQGLGAFKEIGKIVPGAPGGIDQLTKVPVPDVVGKTGTTQIAKTVNKGTKTAVDEPTTPVKTVTKTRSTGIDQLGYNQIDNEFWGGYEPINSKKEFELELKSSPREIKHLIVNWTASAENEFYTAKIFNRRRYKAYTRRPEEKRAAAGEPIGRHGYQRCNYLIRKDGVVERLIPIGTAPTTFLSSKLEEKSKSKYQKIHDKGIMVTFDAGILGEAPDAGLNYNNLSEKSITAEQWKSFDMIIDVMYRHSPGGVFKGNDQLLNESETLIENKGGDYVISRLQKLNTSVKLIGPAFDVGEYLAKKREIPDGDDGSDDDDPYADLTDDYLNDGDE